MKLHTKSTSFPFSNFGFADIMAIEIDLGCLLTAAATAAWLSMTSAPFGSLHVQSSHEVVAATE
jgi:hypothetical protein